MIRARSRSKSQDRHAALRFASVALLALLDSIAPCADASTAPAPSATTFDVWEYRVDGNVTLTQREIEAALYSLLGEGKTLNDVESAAKALEDVYRAKGYPAVVVSVPEQQVEGGVVRLLVVEGRVDRVRVKGSRYYSNDAIRDAVPSLAQGQTLHVPSVSEDLTTLQRRAPDRVIRPVLRSGQDPGTVDVDLVVEDKLPLHGSVGVDNNATRDTSSTRLNVSLGYDNLWQQDQSVRLIFQDSPEQPDEVKVFAGTYIFRFQSSPTMLALTYVDNQSNVASVSDTLVIGKGKSIGARLIEPLPAHGDWFHSITFGYDYKDFDDTVAVLHGTGLETRVTYGNGSVAYGFGRDGEGSRLQASIAANAGIRGLFNETNEFADKRFKGNANYIYLRGDLEYQHALPLGMAIDFNLTGQTTQGALISNEQFGIGGWSTVRGYYEAEELGDYGAALQVELRSPNFANRLGDWVPLALRDAYLTLFTDYGSVGVNDPLPGQADQTRLRSVGIGLRLSGAAGWEGHLFWALPLESGEATASSDSKTLFNVTYGF